MFRLIQASLISSLIVLTSACSTLQLEGEPARLDKETYISPYFSKQDKEYMYSVKIDVYKHELNGILAVKNLGENHHRMALLSDFGNTLFDMEFKGEAVEVHYAMDGLNKGIIINKLKKYFQLLVHSEYRLSGLNIHQDEKIYLSRFQNKNICLHEIDGQLRQIKKASKFKEKVNLHFYGKGDYADSIAFESHELPIKMNFKKRD